MRRSAGSRLQTPISPGRWITAIRYWKLGELSDSYSRTIWVLQKLHDFSGLQKAISRLEPQNSDPPARHRTGLTPRWSQTGSSLSFGLARRTKSGQGSRRSIRPSRALQPDSDSDHERFRARRFE